MEIKQSFTVARPLPEVWELFQDVPTVAGCMPGAALTADKGDGVYAGKVSIKLGPFSASFEGEATVTPDPATHSGHAEGKGVDKRGGSRSRLTLDYRLSEAEGGTKVDVTADVQLAGPIAQFGRTGIINETAKVLIGQFVRNVEARLASSPAVSAPVASPEEGEAAPAPRTPAPSPAPGTQRPALASSNEISAFRLLGAVIATWFRRLFSRGK